MKVGFTGTRKGMSQDQLDQLYFVLGWFVVPRPPEFHYSTHVTAELVADRQAAAAAARFGCALWAHNSVPGAELARDRALVDAVDVLVAAPGQDDELLRSGTWATVRYMQQLKRPVIHLSVGGRAHSASGLPWSDKRKSQRRG